MDLRANAIITAIDRFSGPVQRMAGALRTLQERSATVANQVSRAGSRAVSLPAVAGMGLLLERTQEFEKYALSTKIASIPDHIKSITDELGRVHRIIDWDAMNAGAERFRENARQLSKELGLMPTAMMKSVNAAAKLGLGPQKSQTLSRQAGIWAQADNEMPPDQGVDFLGKMGVLFRAPGDAAGYDNFIKALAGKVKTIADASPTSLRPFSEGLRQFAPIFALAGGNIDQAAALLATATTMGQGDVETGTGFKAGMVRFINPTAMATASFSRQGLDRSKFMSVVPQDPIKATNQLVQQFAGYIPRTARRDMRTILEKAIKDGDVLGAIGPITARITKAGKGALHHDDVALAVANTITTTGTRFDYYAYLRDTAEALQKGEIGLADIIARFTGHHASRILAVLSRPELLDKYLKLSQSDDGTSQDVRQQAYDESRYGKWSRVKAAVDRMIIDVGGSDPILRFVEWLERLADGSERLEFAPVRLGEWLGDKTREPFENLKQKFAEVPGIFDTFGEAISRFIERLAAAKDAILAGRFWEALDYLRGKREAGLADGSGSPSVLLVSQLEPLARTTDELIRAIQQPREVQVSGEAAVKVQSQVTIEFKNGVPIVTGVQGGSGETKVQLRNPPSMGDLGVP